MTTGAARDRRVPLRRIEARRRRAFRSAAGRVDLGERTTGFAYVDLDGLIPFIESVAGPDAVPAATRGTSLAELDSFILQSDADGDLARVSGFVRIPG